MKLFASFSEAMREGAKLRPQAFGHWYDSDGGSCAIGAALEAILERPASTQFDWRERSTEFMTVMQNYRDNLNHVVAMPCGRDALTDGSVNGDGTRNALPRLDNICVHLNNTHRWTREQIADWLESEEEKLGYVTVVESEANVFATQFAPTTAVRGE